MGHFKVNIFRGGLSQLGRFLSSCLPLRRNVQPSNGVMSSQSDNVVTFVWPPVHQGLELATRSKILLLRRGLWNFLKNLSWRRLLPQALKFVIEISNIR
jgi:hypothetical protein